MPRIQKILILTVVSAVWLSAAGIEGVLGMNSHVTPFELDSVPIGDKGKLALVVSGILKGPSTVRALAVITPEVSRWLDINSPLQCKWKNSRELLVQRYDPTLGALKKTIDAYTDEGAFVGHLIRDEPGDDGVQYGLGTVARERRWLFVRALDKYGVGSWKKYTLNGSIEPVKTFSDPVETGLEKMVWDSSNDQLIAAISSPISDGSQKLRLAIVNPDSWKLTVFPRERIPKAIRNDSVSPLFWAESYLHVIVGPYLVRCDANSVLECQQLYDPGISKGKAVIDGVFVGSDRALLSIRDMKRYGTDPRGKELHLVDLKTGTKLKEFRLPADLFINSFDWIDD